MAVTQVAYEVEGWGVGELVVVDDRVAWHELPRPLAGHAPEPSQTPSHPGPGPVVSENPSHANGGFVGEVIRVLEAYFGGDPDAPVADVPIDLEYDSPFLRRCADALRAVPRGEVVTYGELAALAGAPGAARAAGSFCARNRLGLFVPCHRVVAAGGVGPYGSHGTDYKRRLLALEGYRDAV